MRFLPDSAILGTLGHIKHRVKKPVAKSPIFLFKTIDPYFNQQRTVGELLELAGHAQKKKKAGK